MTPDFPTVAEQQWQHAIDEHVDDQRGAGLSNGTQIESIKVLNRFSQSVDVGPWEVTPADVMAYFSAHPLWAPNTRAAIRTRLRSFYRWAVLTDRSTIDPTLRLRPIIIPPAIPKPTPEQVLAAALARADARVRLMLMLGAFAGLRRAEIATLHTDAIMGDSLRVKGKGGKTRVVPIHPLLKPMLELVKLEPGFVFPGRVDGHMSPDSVGMVMSRALGGSGWTAHTLRHRFATRAYAAQRDLRAVQQLLGHSSPTTTARYTALPDDSLRSAVDAV